MINRIKNFLPALIIAGIIIFSVKLFVAKKKANKEELMSNGNKTEAIIKDIKYDYYFINKARKKQYYYKLTLNYNDLQGNLYKNFVSINDYDFKEKKIGDKIEIFYSTENPKEITLVDYQKIHKTPERILLPNDLLSINKNKNTKSIYDNLNKISYGWEIDQNDSTLFLNKRRKSFIYVRKDSIAYYHNSFLDNQILENDLNQFEKIESKRVAKKPINIDLFEPKSKPLQNFKMRSLVNHYQKDNLNFYSSEINDYSNKPWFSLVLKTTNDRKN
ncbi:hypothetical protein [Tenacibaculum geojense]|uniref:Uncharacterized protein n=1 Tax=Tenacibaculum geojense TaxID=915352 RepID=A0ABW3JML6_9FLAO